RDHSCTHALSIKQTVQLSNSSSCASTPTPVTNIPSEVDPFAGLQAPTVGSCTAHPAKVSVSGGTPTLSPGTYCGGISVSNATVTFSPGLYILAKNTNNSAGVGLTSSGGNTHLLGTGVTFYIDSGQINVNGGQLVDFSAPTTGTWESILFFQSRANVLRATLTGGSTMNLEGAP